MGKAVTPCRSCGGQPKRKRTSRRHTLEAGLARYYWYECACGLREGVKQYFTKKSHARAHWNAQNALVQAVNKLYGKVDALLALTKEETT